MKKLLVVAMISAGLLSTLPASADQVFAVVDVQKVVGASQQVAALKKEHTRKLQELQKWLETVKADIAKQSDKDARAKLIKKYDAEFVKRQEAIKKDYAKKTQAIDKSISDTITKEAQAKKYDMVFSKGVVLYGGKDITADVIKNVK